MQVRGKSGNEHLAHVARIRYAKELYRDEQVACEGHIHMTDAFIDWGSRAERFRPCVVMCGNVESVSLEKGALPYGITKINFEDDKQPRVTYRYQLDNQEVADLAMKGLFGVLDEQGRVQDTQFACPPIFLNAPFDLPMQGSAMVVPPAQETDVPLVFFSVNQPHALDTCSAQSGYGNLAEYFEEMLHYVPQDVMRYDMQQESGQPAYAQQPSYGDRFADIEDQIAASREREVPIEEQVYLGQEQDQAREFAEAMERAEREEAAERAMQMEMETPEQYQERVTLEQAAANIESRVRAAMKARQDAKSKRLQPEGEAEPVPAPGVPGEFADIGDGEEAEGPGVPIQAWRSVHDEDEKASDGREAVAVGSFDDLMAGDEPDETFESGMSAEGSETPADGIQPEQAPEDAVAGDGDSGAAEGAEKADTERDLLDAGGAGEFPDLEDEGDGNTDLKREQAKLVQRMAAEQNRYENDIDDAQPKGGRRTIPARFEDLAREDAATRDHEDAFGE